MTPPWMPPTEKSFAPARPSRDLFAKRHYAELAAIIASLPPGQLSREAVAAHFASAFANTQPAFREDKWFAATCLRIMLALALMLGAAVDASAHEARHATHRVLGHHHHHVR